MIHSTSSLRRVRRTLCAIVVIGASLATAEQGWRPAQVFVHDDDGAATNIDANAQITVDPLGNAYLSGGVDRYAVRPPAGSFGTVQVPPGADDTGMSFYSGGYPRFAFDASGNGLMLYVVADPVSAHSANLEIVHRPAGVAPALPAPQSLGKVVFGKFHGAAVAMNDLGEAIVAWVEPSGSPSGKVLRVASRPAGASALFDTAAAGTFPLVESDQDVYAAIDPDGSALVVWSDKTTYWQSARSGSGGSFSAPAMIGVGDSLRPLVVASNRAGDSVITWLNVVLDPTPSAARSVEFASYRPRGGAFQAPQAITPQPPSRWAALDAAAAVLADGTAIVATASAETRQVACDGFTQVAYEQTVVFLSSYLASGPVIGWTAPAMTGLDSQSGTGAIAYALVSEARLATAGDRFVLAYQRERYVAPDGYCGFERIESGTEVFAHFGQGTTAGEAVAVPGSATSGSPNGAGLVDVAMDANGNVLFATESTGAAGHSLRIVPYEDGAAVAGIVSATPVRLSIGSSITISGAGFTTKPKAWLDLAGKKVPLKVAKGATDTLLNALLATTGKGVSGSCVLNVLPKGTKTPFTFPGLSIEKSTIDSIAPANGAAGTAVTITGSFFGTKKGHVLVGGSSAKVTTWTDTSITFTVPKKLTPGTALPVVVENHAGSVKQSGAFTPN